MWGHMRVPPSPLLQMGEPWRGVHLLRVPCRRAGSKRVPRTPPLVLASGRTLAIEGAVQHVEQYGYLLDATAVEVAMVTAALRQRRM